MKKLLLTFMLILVLLFLAGFSDSQAITTAPMMSSTQPPMVNMTTRLGSYGDWSGYVVDQFGNGVGDIPVTLHILGNYSNGTAYEIVNLTRITNDSFPSVGYFNFNDITFNLSGVSAPYGYLDAIGRTADNRTMYGKINNHTLMFDGACTVGSVVLTTPISGLTINNTLISYPTISVNRSSAANGQSITVWGRNFTPNGMAVLYVMWNGPNLSTNYSANVDINGNTSWSFNVGMGQFTIYALDGNLTSRESNTLTVIGLLDDATPSPGFLFNTAILMLTAACSILIIRDRHKKK
jgi:hypothetical protein